MNIIAFAPMWNTRGRHDATGAFQPETEAFCRLRNAAFYIIDNHGDGRSMRREVYTALGKQRSPIGAIAFFCHGSRRGIQLGFSQPDVLALAGQIARSSTPDVRVVLYACNAGHGPRADAEMEAFGGDGGFADLLRDALCAAGAVDCQVDAHTTAGHTTRNPFVRRFSGMGSKVGGIGGHWLVAPRSTLWARWRLALREGLRFDFPFLSVAEIHDRLVKP